MDQIDQQLPNSFSQVLSSTLSIIGSAFAICVVTPSFSLVMIVISIFYVSITSYFRNVARELKRVDALTRSPIFAHFGETLNGLPVIRSYQRQEMYRKGNEVKLDDNLSAYYSMKAVDRWLSVRLEFLGNIIVLFSSVLAVITGSKAGSAGLSLNNAIGVTGLLNWAVRNGLETESLMTSVERVLYTSEQTPQEAPTEQNEIPADAFYANSKYYYPNTTAVAESMVNISSVSSPENEIRIAEEILKAQDHSQDAQVISLSHNAASAFYPTNDQQLLQSGWPWKGSIIMKNLMMRYREDFEYVLRGVDVEIEAGERVGIVGRTGSGKRYVSLHYYHIDI